ncbi:MAG TPA: dihydrofolate reductase family protein [Candidatus Paceibacterota bacterium]|nr:dihydrofolate reductase family protein [Candidatus Paceibacterota bacterium]
MKRHKCSLIAAISLDGKISDDPKHMPDWTSKEDWREFQKFLSTSDLVVSGRNTYEAAKDRMNKRNALIVTTKKKVSPFPNVRFVNPKKEDVLKIIRAHQNVAILGGAGVYNLAMRKKWCTDIYLTLEPVLLGKGISLFTDDVFSRLQAKPVSQKKLNRKGTLLLHYKLI